MTDMEMVAQRMEAVARRAAAIVNDREARREHARLRCAYVGPCDGSYCSDRDCASPDDPSCDACANCGAAVEPGGDCAYCALNTPDAAAEIEADRRLELQRDEEARP